ncbi:MAG: hypothetical protein ABSG16_09405 [Candidatus Acidiferrum sp.]
MFPIYVALAKQLAIDIPIPPAKRSLPEKADLELFSQVQTWLDSMDHRVLVHELRHLLQMTTLNASETGLQALIQRHMRKPTKSTIDRDKIDFLLVQYFALCAPPKIYHKQIAPEDVATVLKPVLGVAPVQQLAWCEPLERMIEALRGFRTLRSITKSDFIAQGRKVKESAGASFYEPSALLAFTRFNFMLRRTLIELMHADLIAIRAGLQQLENGGIASLNCTGYNGTGAEPLAKIKQVADEWKQPFQKEYTESSVTQAFEKLLGLRSDVELALEKAGIKNAAAKADKDPAEASTEAAARIFASAVNLDATGTGATGSPVKNAKGEKAPSAAPADASASEGPASVELDFESCLEKIWEQLIATPPSRGRSMTTVKVGAARILMSSWEVAAFVTEDGASAEDLRRAVVARTLVNSALETAKETGNATSLDRALSVARIEVTRLQERVDVAKQAKDTEAAVNLGISTKRLLSALDEAEKL